MPSLIEESLTSNLATWLNANRPAAIPSSIPIQVANRDELRTRPCIVVATGAVLASTETVDLSADSPDLSGVATDGSAVLFVQASSGIVFSKIVGVDDVAKTVMVSINYSVSESGKTWAIGGKRATWDDADSRAVFADANQDWIIETETDQDLTSAIALAGSGNASERSQVIIRGTDQETLCVVTQTTSAEYIFAQNDNANWAVEWLHFKHSGATPAAVVSEVSLGEWFAFRHCIIGDAAGGDNPTGVISRMSGYCSTLLFDCEVRYCTSWAVQPDWQTPVVIGCYIHHCYGGINVKPKHSCMILDSVIVDNTMYGILFSEAAGNAGNMTAVRGCTIANNGSHGIFLTGVGRACMLVSNNILAGNGGYGIAAASAPSGDHAFQYYDHNNLHGNSSGATSNIPPGENNVSLDPQFVDAANGDYTPGENMKAIGFPGVFRGGTMTGYLDLGGVQREAVGGGGGIVKRIGIGGGLIG